MIKARRLEALEFTIRRVEGRLASLHHTSNRLSWTRLIIVLGGFALSIGAFLMRGPWIAGGILTLTLVAFGIAVFFHRRIERGIARFIIWRDIKTAQLARGRLDWARMPAENSVPQNPLEIDLDLIGDRSLMRLLNTAVSASGSTRLRDWLGISRPELAETVQRQNIVRELESMPLFRDKLILYGRLAAGSNQQWQPRQLLTWLDKRPPLGPYRAWLVLSASLAAVNILLFTLARIDLVPPLWQFTLVVYLGLFLVRSRELTSPFHQAAELRDALAQLLAVFGHIERSRFHSKPNLRSLCAPFLDPESRPSQQLRRLNTIVNATAIRGNPLFWLFLNLFVPWDFYFAYLLEKRKEEIAGLLPGWLDIWYQLEALSSLANFAYLNPGFAFPDFVPLTAGSKVFEAVNLGHPLIPDHERICNDFTIAERGEIVLLTGSNMSGKSTFLRTVGLNLILAYAGGVVSASSMRTLPFRLHTCVRISDSVTDGVSYFYAEVKCLKALLDELEREDDQPLLYFIDEIFRGTNNRERLIGSRSYVKAAASRSGVGLIATHDLELVHLAEEIPSIQNYHFTDEVKDGRMSFDYKLRSGPSPTTNALKIMRLEGLPVQEM